MSYNGDKVVSNVLNDYFLISIILVNLISWPKKIIAIDFVYWFASISKNWNAKTERRLQQNPQGAEIKALYYLEIHSYADPVAWHAKNSFGSWFLLCSSSYRVVFSFQASSSGS